MSLMLHCGAEAIDYDALRQLTTPEPTATHMPIEHFRVVDLVKASLGMFGHVVTDEHHAVTEDAARYFGLFSLRSPYTGYEDTVIVRNSNDRSFPVAVGIGHRCFCCDNLAFIADRQVKRRHTPKLKRDLPGLITEMVEPLALEREAQAKKIAHYRETTLTDELAHHAILSMYKAGVINVQRIPPVLQQWEEPQYDDWLKGTAWHLLNCATYSLEGRIAENPNATVKLHDVIDATCARLN